MRLASFVPSAARLPRPDPAPDHGDRMPTPAQRAELVPLAQIEDDPPSLTIEEFVSRARMSGAL